jgi:hypothetical protein
VIVTADHGGGGNGTTPNQHGNPLAPEDFTIPFYVWGDGVNAGDLYAFNAARGRTRWP